MKENLSIDQILKSIRQVILGKNTEGDFNRHSDLDVLELTKIVSETSEKNITEHSNVKEKKKLEREDNLVSDKSAKETLKHIENIKQHFSKNTPTIKEGKTVEELVIEVMKPQISEWLDHNLPRIVKNVVEKEIKKLMSHENNSNFNS
jgi:cell pole-organizing protein PopZ